MSPRTLRRIAAALLLGAPACTTSTGGGSPAGDPALEAYASLRAKYDRDGDGRISAAEYGRDAATFRRLDKDGDGFVTEADLRAAPSPPADLVGPFLFVEAFGSRGASSVSAEEAVRAIEDLDENGDDRVSREELLAHAGPQAAGALLPLLDANRDGLLDAAELRAYVAARDKDGDGRIAVRERFETGREPPVGRFAPGTREAAPDFKLPRLDGGGEVALRDLRGRPVALLFGSFT